jgi:hypothetical protein
VSLTEAVVSCGPDTTGVEASAAAFAKTGTGAAPDSEIAVTRPSSRPAAFASTAARSPASATALASAWR